MKLLHRVGAREAAVIGPALGCVLAMASAVDVVWLRPLPFPDADRLVSLSESKRGDTQRYPTTWGNFRKWNPQRLMLDGIGAYKPADPVLSTTGEPQSFTIVRVTPSLLSTLATEPSRGRSLVESDSWDGSHAVMLTDQAWTQAFGRREEVINSTIILDGVVCSVVGVAAPEVGALIRLDILTPLIAPQEGRGDRLVRVVGRLRKGATPEATARALGQQVKSLEVEHRENQGFDGGIVVSLREALVGDLRRPVLGLGVLAAFLLLVMGVNVVGLRLAGNEALSRVRAVNPSLAVGPLLPMSSRLADFERPRVFATTCLVVLALVSTMLALVGVYCRDGHFASRNRAIMAVVRSQLAASRARCLRPAAVRA
jgi:putative ABC transport system permease protein